MCFGEKSCVLEKKSRNFGEKVVWIYKLQHRSERAINNANNQFFWPHARGHVHAYLGLPHPSGRDSVKPGPVHVAVQGVMQAQVEVMGQQREEWRGQDETAILL